MPNPYKGQKRIKEVVYKILAPTLEKQGWYLSKIILDWEVIIGPQWKSDIWPTRFHPSYKDKNIGTLRLKATHKGLQQATFMKGMLLEKINMYLGCKALNDIKVQLWHPTITSPTKSFKKATPTNITPPNIRSESLKLALMELGKNLGGK